MKRYKLKRELPIYPISTEFTLEDGALMVEIEEGVKQCVYSAEDIQNFPDILTEWFEEIPEEPKTVYNLKIGDIFWYSDVTCNICYKLPWDPVYTAERSFGLVSLTEEEAKKKLAWLKVREILRQDTKGLKCELGEPSWKVFYDYNAKKLSCTSSCNVDGTIRFKRFVDAETSTQIHSTEWKVYLGVEE